MEKRIEAMRQRMVEAGYEPWEADEAAQEALEAAARVRENTLSMATTGAFAEPDPPVLREAAPAPAGRTDPAARAPGAYRDLLEREAVDCFDFGDLDAGAAAQAALDALPEDLECATCHRGEGPVAEEGLAIRFAQGDAEVSLLCFPGPEGPAWSGGVAGPCGGRPGKLGPDEARALAERHGLDGLARFAARLRDGPATRLGAECIDAQRAARRLSREEGQGALAASHALPNGGRGTREASPRGR